MAARITAITMPKWGIEMTEGTINAWLLDAGRHVAQGDPLLEVETEKIVNTVEAPASGSLRRITAGAGEARPVGSLIGVLAEPDVPDAEIDAFISDFRGAAVSYGPEGSSTAEAAPAAAPDANATARAGSPGDTRVSPLARRLAERHGVDLSRVQGTGRNGRISKEDVEAYLAARSSAAGAADTAGIAATATEIANPPTRRRISATRATIAKRLLLSTQTIPHYRLAIDVDVGELSAHRQELTEGGATVTINDLLLRAVSLALVRHRALNARFENDECIEYAHADIAIAVATDAGLLAPVVRRVDLKTPARIAQETAELSQRARAGALTRSDVEEATFTVSNLGMFGIERFDAIINPPQVAILAVGAATERIVSRQGAPASARMVALTLSADHRVVDGAVAAAFLATLRKLVEAGCVE